MDAPTSDLSTTGLKFQLDRTLFSEAVAWVAKVLPSRPTQPVLAGMLLTGTESELIVSGFDYEVSAEVRLPADIFEKGSTLVSGRLLSDITKSLPSKKPVEVQVSSNRVSLTCGNSYFSLPILPLEDYPPLPDLPEITGKISAELFAEAINQVSLAAGRDDTLPMLTGIRMEIQGQTMTLAATDRFRLAVREIDWDTQSDTKAEILIPAKNLVEAAKANIGSSEIQLALGSTSSVGADGTLGILSSGKQSTTRLLDTDFPKFRQLFPTEHMALAVMNVSDLIEVIKRVSLVAERGSQIRLEFNEGSVHISAGSDEFGRAEENILANFVGTPLTIAFNPGYLIDGLNAINTEFVLMGFIDPKRPVVLRPVTNNVLPVGSGPYPAISSDYVYLLMPVRLPN